MIEASCLQLEMVISIFLKTCNFDLKYLFKKLIK